MDLARVEFDIPSLDGMDVTPTKLKNTAAQCIAIAEQATALAVKARLGAERAKRGMDAIADDLLTERDYPQKHAPQREAALNMDLLMHDDYQQGQHAYDALRLEAEYYQGRADTAYRTYKLARAIIEASHG